MANTDNRVNMAASGSGDGFDATFNSEKFKKKKTFIYPFEAFLLSIKRLLLWENPWKSGILFTFIHILIWFVYASSMKLFFLLSVFFMAAILFDSWKYKLMAGSNETSEHNLQVFSQIQTPGDVVGVSEMSSTIDDLLKWWKEKCVKLRRFRISHPLVFCLGNTTLFTLTAMVGYQVSDFLLIYTCTIILLLWPAVSHNSLLKKGFTRIQPFYLRLKGSLSERMYRVVSLGGRLKIPKFFTYVINQIKSLTEKENLEDEDFMLQENNDVALRKAITDSEEDTNSDIPTPRMSKAPSFNNMFGDNSNSDSNDLQDQDFELHLSQMPSFDDFDNTDDELEFSSISYQKSKSNEPLVTAVNESDFDISSYPGYSNDKDQNLEQASTMLGFAQKVLSTPQTGVIVAQTLSTMMESALQSSLGHSQPATSMVSETGTKITYRRSDDGECVDFQNSEPAIEEEEEDLEEQSYQIAEIENSFDFLEEFDPNLTDDF